VLFFRSGLAPACLDDLAPDKERTTWLAIFYSAIPVGGALGYVGGGLVAKWSWHAGFLIEGLAALPFAFLAFFVKRNILERQSDIVAPVASSRSKMAEAEAVASGESQGVDQASDAVPAMEMNEVRAGAYDMSDISLDAESAPPPSSGVAAADIAATAGSVITTTRIQITQGNQP